MGAKLKKIGLISISIVIVIYASFPWWSASIVKQYLPQDWKIVTLDIGYPSLSALSVEKLSVKTEQFSFNLEQIKVTTNFKYINIKLAQFKLKHQQDHQTKLEQKFELPALPLKPLYQKISHGLKSDINLSVAKFELQSQSERYEVSNIRSIFKPNSTGEISFNIEPNQFISSAEKIESSVQLSVDQLIIDLRLAKQQILKLNYLQTHQTSELDLTVNAEVINKFSSTYTLHDKIGGNIDGVIKISLRQNKLNQLDSKIDYQGSLNFIDTAKKPIVFKLAAHSNSKSNGLAFTTQLETSSSQVIMDNFSLNQPLVSLNTIISVKEGDFSFSNNTLNTDIKSIKLNNNKLSANKVLLETKIEDFTLKQLSLKELAIDNNLINTDISYLESSDELPINGKLMGKVTLSGLIDGVISGELTVYPISIPGVGLSEFAELKIRIDQADSLFSRGTINVKAEDYDGQIRTLSYNKLLSSIRFELGHDLIVGEGNLQINERELTPLIISFNKNNQDLSINSIQHNIDKQLFNQLIKILPEELPLVEMLAGNLVHEGELEYHTSDIIPLNGKSLIKLSNAEIMFDKNRAIGINGISQLKSIKPLKIETSLNIDKIELASGLEISNISSKLVLLDTNFEILDFKMKLLSGNVFSPKIYFENSHLMPSLVTAKKISLTELIFFTEMESLFATGDIDLTIPLLTKDNSVIVENGTFETLAKGIIKYTSGTTITKEENIALFALQNFHYSKMDGTFSYNNKTGLYLLKIHLIGSNPDLYDGYPIDFTFNIDGNLPGVFKSLFLSGSFEEAIMKSVKSEQIQ
jgi:hypothetical protein